MERITEKGVKSYLDLYDRLCDIEDILGEEYDLDQLRELTECMKKGARLIDVNELEPLLMNFDVDIAIDNEMSEHAKLCAAVQAVVDHIKSSLAKVKTIERM